MGRTKSTKTRGRKKVEAEPVDTYILRAMRKAWSEREMKRVAGFRNEIKNLRSEVERLKAENINLLSNNATVKKYLDKIISLL